MDERVDEQIMGSLERTILHQYRGQFSDHAIMQCIRLLREKVGEEVWYRANLGTISSEDMRLLEDASEDLLKEAQHRQDARMN